MDVKSDFSFTEGLDVTTEIQRSFDDNGYVIIRSLLNDAELKKLYRSVEGNKEIIDQGYNVGDGHGRTTYNVIWGHPGNDVIGKISRSQKVAGFTQKLLGGEEVYHYHSKFIMKAPRTGGQFNWHQDYGYWYDNGCLFPYLSSTFLAYDKCDKENGCVQVLPGSHKLGRIRHVAIQDQIGADMERVEYVKKRLGPPVYVELEAGDAIFFHCNLLHCSNPNNSDRRRWGLIMCYNRKDNNPVTVHHHPQFTPMTIIPDAAILEGPDEFHMAGKEFFNPMGHEKVRFREEEK